MGSRKKKNEQEKNGREEWEERMEGKNGMKKEEVSRDEVIFG